MWCAPAFPKCAAAGRKAGGGRLSSLADLAEVAVALKQTAQQQEAERQAAAAAQRQREAEANLFRDAIGAVEPVKAAAKRAPLTPPKPAPLPLQTQRAEQAIMAAALSDEFDPDNLFEADGEMSFRRPALGIDVLRKLRRGEWVVQAEIDLHGMRREEARDALAVFLKQTVRRGLRCVRVVHGKGLGSPGKQPVLKGKVRSWLVQKEEVLAFVEAREMDGGAGAVLVLLQGG